MDLIRNTKGLTLIEVIIAFAILLIILIPILNIIESCTNSYRLSGERSQIVEAGKGIMERIIAERGYPIQNKSELNSQRFPEMKYDLDISTFKGDSYLREIVVTIYPKKEPHKQIIFSTVRLNKE